MAFNIVNGHPEWYTRLKGLLGICAREPGRVLRANRSSPSKVGFVVLQVAEDEMNCVFGHGSLCRVPDLPAGHALALLLQRPEDTDRPAPATTR